MSVLAALADGRALPVGALAAETGLSPRAVREQVAALVAEGRVEVIVSGPYRYFRSAPDARADVAGFVVRSLREGTPAYDLRLARRCYGHRGAARRCRDRRAAYLRVDRGGERGRRPWRAGGLAVHGRRLAGGVVDSEPYRVTGAGLVGLGALGVRMPARLGEVRCCVDWTEQRHLLAGPLGPRCSTPSWRSAGSGSRRPRGR